MSSIELSPKHGLNPTIPVCFFCGEDKGEIALLGRVREKDPTTGRAVSGSDLEVPMKMIMDYIPCEKCREKFAQGVLLIEVSNSAPDGRPPIQDHLYPTGRHLVITEDGAQRIFQNHNLKKGGTALIDSGLFTMLTTQQE